MSPSDPRPRTADDGRPSKFDSAMCEQARKLCLLGATDEQLADFFQVSTATLYNWKKQFPDFLEAITRGKAIADAEVAASLYHRACGYSHPDVHVSSFEGAVTLTSLTKHYPPDTPAASLWLRNRQPKLWRDKMEIAHSGGLSTVSDDQIDARIAELAGKAGLAGALGGEGEAEDTP